MEMGNVYSTPGASQKVNSFQKLKKNKNNKHKSRPGTVIYCEEGVFSVVFALLRLELDYYSIRERTFRSNCLLGMFKKQRHFENVLKQLY